jgi:hypothetical protein
MMLSYGELVRLIKGAEKDPVERNSLYETVRTFEPDDPIFDPEQGSVPGAPADADLVQLVGTGRA